MIAYLFTLLICFGIPLGALVWFLLRRQGYGKAYFLGAATFALFQLFTRIPLLQYALPNASFYFRLSMDPLWYPLFLGATAALFEEGGRYIMMRCFLKRRTYTDGLAFGMGHGGLEAMLLVGASVLAAWIVTPDALTTSNVILSGVERLLTIPVHVAWSVMILAGLQKGCYKGLLVAFLTHTLLDAGLVLMMNAVIPLYVIEGVLALFTAAAVWYLASARRAQAIQTQAGKDEEEHHEKVG